MAEPALDTIPISIPPSPAGGQPPDSSVITSGMADIAGKKLAEETSAFAETERRTEADRAYMVDRMKAQGQEAEKLRPWNHEEEQKKFQHSPIEAFGSFGSVVGILASAFTRAPMENAFAASAAAMNAVKAGDDEGYKRAFDAYKVNTDLVVKREQMIQNGFNDAAALMRTDMTAGNAKAQNIATRYGDQQALFLLQNGMSKELFEMMSSRAKATSDMAAASAKINETSFRDMQFKAAANEIPEEQRTPQRLMGLWNYMHGMNTTEQERHMEQWFAAPENKGKSLEEAAAAAAQYKQQQRAPKITPEFKEWLKKRKVSHANESPEEFAKAAELAATEFSASKPAPDTREKRSEIMSDESPDPVRGGQHYAQLVTVPRLEAAEIKRRMEELIATGVPPGEAYRKAVQETPTRPKPPSGNQLDKLQGMVDQTTYFEMHLDKADELLRKHNAITGLGGTLTRPLEVIGNIFGSNETDRAQFRREVLGMGELAARILTGSAGRPLSAEAKKIEGIVAGLAAGDTKTNTLRAYDELRPLLKKIREDLEKRRIGPNAPASPSGGSSAPAGSGKQPKWMNAPVVGPRSDIEANDNVAMSENDNAGTG